MEYTFLPDPKKDKKLRKEKVIFEFEEIFNDIPEEEEKRLKERFTESSKEYIKNYPLRLKEEVELYETSEFDFLISEIKLFEKTIENFEIYEPNKDPFNPSLNDYDYRVGEYVYFKLGSKLFINRQQRKLDFLNKQKGQIWITFDSSENEVTQHEPPPENGNLKPTTDNLTLKQQILLLDILGVLDLLKDLETTKKSELISNLISKNEQNVRNCLTYYHSSSNQNPLQNPANPKKILELLEKVGLTQYAEIAKEKLQKSLEEKKTNSEKTK